jgi:hypothetical protein
MGYTHYWYLQRSATDEERAAIQSAATAIFAATAVPLDVQRVTGSMIAFNGVGDDAHEPFWLMFDIGVDDGLRRETDDGEFYFTKTAVKPYDEVVVAMLCAVCHLAPGFLKPSSDGRPVDWDLGCQLAREALQDPSIVVPAFAG